MTRFTPGHEALAAHDRLLARQREIERRELRWILSCWSMVALLGIVWIVGLWYM